MDEYPLYPEVFSSYPPPVHLKDNTKLVEIVARSLPSVLKEINRGGCDSAHDPLHLPNSPPKAWTVASSSRSNPDAEPIDYMRSMPWNMHRVLKTKTGGNCLPMLRPFRHGKPQRIAPLFPLLARRVSLSDCSNTYPSPKPGLRKTSLSSE